ncbi:MAG TPA: tyrosine-type recombinase/integrase [Bryobacteraceae bacterium]|nr:tyrosine-type recombinase/integrase [Bryobacteraceae bacterium]
MGNSITASVPLSADEHAIVGGETNSGKPSKGDFEKMARRRFQDPRPKRLGKWWYLLCWQDEFIDGRRIRKRKRLKLAPAIMPEREVQKIAAESLRPMNQGLVTVGSATKFEDYVENVYRPTVLPLLSKTTQDRYANVIKVHLMPTFGQLCLRDLTPLAVQRYFSGMAQSPLSYESRDKIRDVLSSALGSAVQYGLLVRNPVQGLKVPPPKKGRRSKPYITPDQFHALLANLQEPYASMIFVAVCTGFRVSELVGLRWRNVHVESSSITIDERCCRGDWSAPKSDASNATVAVNRAVIERILRLKSLVVTMRAGRAIRRVAAVKSDRPEDLVFQSPLKGGPMQDSNVLVRHLKPAAKKQGIGWVNWQVLRRSFATWLKIAGADVKDAQALMRHSRASTTLDIYQQFVPESQRRVVENLGRLAEPVRVN